MTALFLDLEMLNHDTGPLHPERPSRLQAISDAIERDPELAALDRLTAEPADLGDILAFHDAEYLQRFKDACAGGHRVLDTPDCAICPRTYELARLSAGGVLAAVDAVLDGRCRNAFCAVRPPGHHAERGHAMGFCFFSNLALAARRVQQRGPERVLIFDFDVHHGNGTQHAFEDDPTVFFCSIHEDPRYLFPGTGFAHEVGTGRGRGTTMNLPKLPGATDADYRKDLEAHFLPAAREFKPDFVLVSAGFDAHAADPIAHIELTTDAFVWMTRMIREVADEFCDGRLVSVLEGGYDLEALKACVSGHVHTLMRGASG